MSLYLRLAWRNVWRQRRRTFLIAGAMGVIMAFLVIYDGMLVGFEQAIYGNAIEVMGGNIQVHAPGYKEKTGSTSTAADGDPDGVVQASGSAPGCSPRRPNVSSPADWSPTARALSLSR